MIPPPCESLHKAVVYDNIQVLIFCGFDYATAKAVFTVV